MYYSMFCISEMEYCILELAFFRWYYSVFIYVAYIFILNLYKINK